MNIEVLLGRSEIYDILTHLTFLFIEADKIRNLAFIQDENWKPTRAFKIIEEVVKGEKNSAEKKKKLH
jgi:hypothetical protein